ncbi:UNVERIFIED_ORG: putative molybdopterin biosynthesis protein [Peribacillus simplex]
MKEERSYTTEEISKLLRVSKLTVYDLIKKGELPAYQVGRQMRIDAEDLENYINQSKNKKANHTYSSVKQKENSIQNVIRISGQDLVLDILANLLEVEGFKSLRDYSGSLNSLIAMYNGHCQIVSTHLFDGDTGEYNIPYIKRILTGRSYIVINLVSRWTGFYVSTGNPKKIKGWEDLDRKDVKIINREIGSGARVLLDEQLRIHQMSPKQIKGYDKEESNHISVATSVAQGIADIGVGMEKAASIVGVEFIPLIKESYDLVILKSEKQDSLIQTLLDILNSSEYINKLNAIKGYDTSKTGSIVFETE